MSEEESVYMPKPMPGPMPPPPPPFRYESSVQRFRDAVRQAANIMLDETGICPAKVDMTWSETKTGGRYLQTIIVEFASDKLDGYDLIMPYYRETDEPPKEPLR